MNKLTQILATKAEEVSARRALRSLADLDAIGFQHVIDYHVGCYNIGVVHGASS